MVNPFDFFDKIYCINLDKRSDRWKEVQEEFTKVGIESKVKRIAGKITNNPFYGCHLAHAECLEQAIKENAQKILIFEDDVEFFEGAQDTLLQSIIELPIDWDMFYLGANLDNYEAKQVSDHLIKLTGAFSTHAYAVKKPLFSTLLHINLDPNTRNNDVNYANLVHPKFNCYLTWPLVAGQRKSYSDIQNKVMESNPVFLERAKDNTKWLE